MGNKAILITTYSEVGHHLLEVGQMPVGVTFTFLCS